MTEFSTMQDVQQFALARRACSEARKWLATQADPATAWETCERPDWMLWLAARRGVDRKTMVRIACACARTSLRFVPDGETRPLKAIEAAEAWCNDRATVQKVRSADAYAAAAARAVGAAVAAVADAAAYAAAAAAYAADAAADAAYAADAANAAAYAAAAWSKAHLEMCVLVRALIPCPSEP